MVCSSFRSVFYYQRFAQWSWFSAANGLPFLWSSNLGTQKIYQNFEFPSKSIRSQRKNPWPLTSNKTCVDVFHLFLGKCDEVIQNPIPQSFHLLSIRLMGWSMHCKELHLWGREDSYDRWKGWYDQRGLTKLPLFWEWFTKTLEKKTTKLYFYPIKHPKCWNSEIVAERIWAQGFLGPLMEKLYDDLNDHRSDTSKTWHKLPSIIWLRHLAEIILPTLGTEFATPTLLLKPDMAIKNESLHSQNCWAFYIKLHLKRPWMLKGLQGCQSVWAGPSRLLNACNLQLATPPSQRILIFFHHRRHGQERHQYGV